MSGNMIIPGEVLAQYDESFSNFIWRPVHGGLSGALIFAGSRTDASQPSLAMKRWPPKTELVQVLAAHGPRELVQFEFAFIPKLIANRYGRSFSSLDGLFWELSDWMPGSPATAASASRVQNAASAIAQLHRQWAKAATLHPSRDVLRPRIEFVTGAIAECGTLSFAALENDLINLCREAVSQLPIKALPIPSAYHAPVKYIHGDLHHEHILFSGDAVSGIIDFASIKRDHPGLDFARYFGECDAIEAGVAAYRQAGGSEAVTPELVHFLDRVILAGSAAHWLKRFARNDVPADRRSAAIARFEKIVERLRNSKANAALASASIP